MFLKKGLTILVLVMFALVSTAAGETAESKYQSEKVDEIYNSIRNAGPRYEAEEQIVNFTNEGMNIVASLVLRPEDPNRDLVAAIRGGDLAIQCAIPRHRQSSQLTL